MRNQYQRLRIILKIIFQPIPCFQVQMIRRFVQQKQTRLLQQQLGKRDAHLPSAAEFLAGTLHNPGAVGIRVYTGLAAFFSLAGVSVAAYHFLIQILPHEELASCGPGASYILEHFSLADSIRLFLTGTGDCTEVVWTFLGLSMPFWVGLSFLGLLALCLWRFALAAPAARIPGEGLALGEEA